MTAVMATPQANPGMVLGTLPQKGWGSETVSVSQVLGRYSTAGEAHKFAQDLGWMNPGAQFAVVRSEGGFGSRQYDVVQLNTNISRHDARRFQDLPFDGHALVGVHSLQGYQNVQGRWPAPPLFPTMPFIGTGR